MYVLSVENKKWLYFDDNLIKKIAQILPKEISIFIYNEYLTRDTYFSKNTLFWYAKIILFFYIKVSYFIQQTIPSTYFTLNGFGQASLLFGFGLNL